MKNNRKTALLHIPLLLVGFTMLLPLIFMLSTALAGPGEAMRVDQSFFSTLIPKSWKWSNFVHVWEIIPFGRYYLNSLLVAVAVTIGQTFTSACAAYAFARLQWKWREQVFMLYLATIMVPAVVTMIPNFAAMKELPELLSKIAPWIDWMSLRVLGTVYGDPSVGRLVGLDSYFALIVPMMFSAYGTFLLRQFFLLIPREMDEAAEIDGCSHWTIFTRIILPLSLPGLATLSIFTFMGVWGSFLWPLIITNDSELNTLPLGLLAFQGQHGTEWSLMMAAALMMLLPIFVIFLVGQRFFVSGLTVGAVKG